MSLIFSDMLSESAIICTVMPIEHLQDKTISYHPF